MKIRNPPPNPDSKTQQRKAAERMKRPVTVIVCAVCGASGVTLRNDAGRKLCVRCARKDGE